MVRLLDPDEQHPRRATAGAKLLQERIVKAVDAQRRRLAQGSEPKHGSKSATELRVRSAPVKHLPASSA